MGGQGGSSGIVEKSKIISFPKKETKKSVMKWDYRGYKESVDKIESAVNEANTRTKVEAAYRAINNASEAITAELNHNDSDGDQRVLMTQRRRLRMLKKKLLSRGILG